MYPLLLIVLYLTGLFLPLSVFLALTLVIGLRFRGYFCLVPALMVDLQFSLATGLLPVYTIATGVVLLLAELIRPRIMIDVSV